MYLQITYTYVRRVATLLHAPDMRQAQLYAHMQQGYLSDHMQRFTTTAILKTNIKHL